MNLKHALFAAVLIFVTTGAAKADTIQLNGTLHLPGESLKYDLTVQTSIFNFVGVNGQTYTAFESILSGMMWNFDGGKLIGTTNLGDPSNGNEFIRLINEPPQVMWEFAAYKPFCTLPLSESEYCPPPPDWALIKKFDLEAISLTDVEWVETVGHGPRRPGAALQGSAISTPEPSTLALLLGGLGLASKLRRKRLDGK